MKRNFKKEYENCDLAAILGWMQVLTRQIDAEIPRVSKGRKCAARRLRVLSIQFGALSKRYRELSAAIKNQPKVKHAVHFRGMPQDTEQLNFNFIGGF